MESVSRRPVRRKHSASNGGGVSSKNPYEDAVLSNRVSGKGKAFEARDYAEIFAGSSSIPVFDISSLDERVGSGEYRASKVDYGDVFGGLRNHDVAVAYEELFNSSVKESNPCGVVADKPLSLQDSANRNSSVKGKRVSGEITGPSPHQDREQFSVASYQQNGHVSDEKEEEAAGYTTFVVNGTPSKSQDERPEFPIKREVSRAWSFSPQVEAVNDRSWLNSGISHDSNEVKSVPESNGKVLEQTKGPSSSLASKTNVSESSVGEASPPFMDTGFDENSPAGVSAAALKKAVDEARESIRQAKMMMERRKKGTKRQNKGWTDQVASGLDKSSESVSTDGDSSPVFAPSDSYIDLVINSGVGKASENVERGKHREKVEAIEVPAETTPLVGSEADEESRTLKNDNDRRFIPSGTVLASEYLGLRKASVHHVKEPEIVRVETEAIAEEAHRNYNNTNQVHGSGNHIEIVGSVPRSSEKDKEREKVPEKSGENLIDEEHNQADKPEEHKENAEGVHNLSECDEKVGYEPASTEQVLEMKLKESSYEHQSRNSEKKLNDECAANPGNIQETEGAASVDACKKQGDIGDLMTPELSRTFYENEVEETVEAEVRSSSVVWDDAKTSNGTERDEDHNNSTAQEAEYEEEFLDEFIHVNTTTTDSEFQHKSEDNEEPVHSPTASEVDVTHLIFDDVTRHEAIDPNDVRSTSDENFAENKAYNGFQGISSVKDAVNSVDQEQNGEDILETTPDAPRDSAAGIGEIPPSCGARTGETVPEHVGNAHEQTSKCCNSFPVTFGQDAADGFSSFESKQGTFSINEEPKDGYEMADEANSESDAKRSGETERNVETTLDAEKDNNFIDGGEKDEQQQRIEAIRKGREREKDRLAVERAIREARERAKEKLERAAAEKQQAEKATVEAKLRAERAAVERATVEARERALEKAKSLKTSTAARPLAEKTASRNDGLKHSFSSSDLADATYPESAQRHKARLERHQRVMERAAKALEEKNKRDLLVQKEQAERNRMAEYLDADIKRWLAGKEGNLRALLSTLHYILGADSGWRAISLTEIITTADMKKAYRKATLCVHPDKLQQRGASIQHKYICEKVFDLLKAAWNKFNSEER